jgi:putative phosphoesterase
LYNRKNCPGNPQFFENDGKKIKVCSDCTFPHQPENYDAVIEILKDFKHKIAVISDTHSLLRPEIKEKLKECELILHAGDISSQETADEITECGKTYFVRGNADKGHWAEKIPLDRVVEIYGLKIYMIHNCKLISQDISQNDIVIYGHSHKYSQTIKDGVCFFNPGSCGPRRFHQDITMAILTVDERDRSFTFEKVDISPVLDKDNVKLPERDMAKLVSNIIKQMNAGKTVDEISRKNRVDVEIVNQILQIYTTHPGIDVQGILDRMDIWGK